MIPQFALEVEAVSDPVDLAWRVVVDLLETQCGEPARGAWAHVSQGIPAVHRHRLAAIQRAYRARGQPLQRYVERTGEMPPLILLARQHLHQLRVPLEQAVQPIQVNSGSCLGRHRSLTRSWELSAETMRLAFVERAARGGFD